MTQDELKWLAARAAVEYVLEKVPQDTIIGIGTGSTVNCFIDAMANQHVFGTRYRGAVSSSETSTARLRAHGIPLFNLDEIDVLPVYVDGADEIDAAGCMIKGGGGALTREKIVAAAARVFVCIAHASKYVNALGNFALPIEIIPLARAMLMRKLTDLGGRPVLRTRLDGMPWVTDNGQHIIDVAGLTITDPVALEAEINNWPGVITVGLFARQRADICLLATEAGIAQLHFPPCI